MKIYMLITAVIVGSVQTVVGADEFRANAQKLRKKTEIELHAEQQDIIWKAKQEQWSSIIKNYKISPDELLLDISVGKDEQELVVYTHKPNGDIICREIDKLDKITRKTYAQLPQIPLIPNLTKTQLLLGAVGIGAAAGSAATLAAKKGCTIL